MTKKELQLHQGVFIQILDKYMDAKQRNDNGKNKAIRDKASNEMDSELQTFENYVNRQDAELFEYINGKGGSSAIAFGWDEFTSRHWFHRDMPRLLEKIRKDISEIEKNEKEVK